MDVCAIGRGGGTRARGPRPRRLSTRHDGRIRFRTVVGLASGAGGLSAGSGTDGAGAGERAEAFGAFEDDVGHDGPAPTGGTDGVAADGRCREHHPNHGPAPGLAEPGSDFTGPFLRLFKSRHATLAAWHSVDPAGLAIAGRIATSIGVLARHHTGRSAGAVAGLA